VNVARISRPTTAMMAPGTFGRRILNAKMMPIVAAP